MLIIGVVKLEPVPNEIPPVNVPYQVNVPVELAPSSTVPASQREPGVVLVIFGADITVNVAAVLVTVEPHNPVTMQRYKYPFRPVMFEIFKLAEFTFE